MLSAHQKTLPIDQIINAIRFLNTTKTLPDMLNKAAKIDNTKTIMHYLSQYRQIHATRGS